MGSRIIGEVENEQGSSIAGEKKLRVNCGGKK
jgi:hypothetical protein